MRSFYSHHKLIIAVAFTIIIGTSYMVFNVITKNPNANLTTTTIKRGSVINTVSVSGVIESNNVADLAFQGTGIVSKIYVKEGDQVKKGDVLATLGNEELIATRASALSDIRLAEADLQQLLNGATSEERAVTETSVSIAEADLKRITQAQNTNVLNAKRNLLNTTITAVSIDGNERAIPPIISGSYNCDTEGAYTMSIYSSGAASGYSFSLSGLEEGLFTASVTQANKFGNCGLYAKFSSGSSYSGSKWLISIPNKANTAYVLNKNAYDKAVSDASIAIDSAKQALTLAQDKQYLNNASPRSEAVDRARARIASTQAQIARIDAQIGNKSVVSPFDGMVSKVDILLGETAPLTPVFSVLSTDTFELTARVPEVDITKVVVGQTADVLFDAKRDTPTVATVMYVSPIPTQINGVAYFTVKLKLNEKLNWIRSGLNADIDIVTDKKDDVLIVPKIYVNKVGDSSSVKVLRGTTKATTTVTVIFTGNDGFSAIEGVNEGTVVISP